MSAGGGHDSSRSSESPGTNEIEVERKFSLSTDPSGATSVESKLKKLGFERAGREKKFTDTYFDTPSPDWVLTTRDNWLRFREYVLNDRREGVWQLKLGRMLPDDATTVYEEISGAEAISTAVGILRQEGVLEPETFAGSIENEDETSSLPKGYGLVPFAAFETTRCGWSPISGRGSPYEGLTVDIDGTDFGYTVGEVEAVVEREKDVPCAKERIEMLLNEIVGAGDSAVPALGKLETYLIKRSPEHYSACIEAGSMKAKKEH